MVGTQEIACIGGGLTGCLVALDCSERGHSVTLFDREPQILTRASLRNEGKVHLGYVYGADPSFRTAARMIDDALRFRHALLRWMSAAQFEAACFAPFDYIVPPDSDLPLEAVEAHFTRVDAYIAERLAKTGLDYLGQRSLPNHARRSANTAQGARLATCEAGVRPASIAAALREAVTAHPRITLRLNCEATRILPTGRGWQVEAAGTPEGPFTQVVNAAWAGRRMIDANSGHGDAQTWFTRFKCGVMLPEASTHLPGALPVNATGTLGRYGDSVYYPQDDTLYCSWYPALMTHTTTGRPEPSYFPPAPEHCRLIQATWEGYAGIDPAYAPLCDAPEALESARLIGDFIMARGRSDIDDPASGLHRRDDHAPRALAPGYWTVETGKYTSAPRCAEDCVAAMFAG